VVTAGLTGLAVLFALTLLWSADLGAGLLLAWFFGVALSMGWVMAPATDAVVGAVPAARSGVASAMNTVARMVSGALGVAVLGSLVNSLYSDDVAGSLPPRAPGGRHGVDRRIAAATAQAPPDVAARVLSSAGDAFTSAMGIGLTVSAGLSLGAAVLVARLLPSQPTGAGAPARSSSIDSSVQVAKKPPTISRISSMESAR
jgi:MFS transporter, DHA2 family, multidrug resistance protein